MRFIKISIKELPCFYFMNIKLINIRHKKIIVEKIVDEKVLSIEELCNIINNISIPIDYQKAKINITIGNYRTFIEKFELLNYKEKKIELKENLNRLYVNFDKDYQVKIFEFKQKTDKVNYYITLTFYNKLLLEAIKLKCSKKISSIAIIKNDIFSFENFLITYLPKDLFEKHFLYIEKNDELFIIYEVSHAIIINYLMYEFNDDIVGSFINNSVTNSIDSIIINSSFKFYIAFTEENNLKNTIYAGYLDFFKYIDEKRAFHDFK